MRSALSVLSNQRVVFRGSVHVDDTAGIVHLDFDDLRTVCPEDGASAIGERRLTQLLKYTPIEEHRMTSTLPHPGTNDRRVRLNPSVHNGGNGRGARHRHIDERHDDCSRVRLYDLIHPTLEGRELSAGRVRVPRDAHTSRCADRLGDLVMVLPRDHDDVADAGVVHGGNDPEHEESPVRVRQQRLRSTHPGRLAGGEDDGGDHSSS